jgi:hypothetical protein
MNSRNCIHVGAFLLLVLVGGACAADSSDLSDRIARLLYVSGHVSVQPHGTDEWVPGSIIRPLTNGDNVWADKNSRAELNLGSGLLRIDSETSLTLTNVTEMSVQVELNQGMLTVDIRRLERGEIYEIDTPNLKLTVTTVGDYRIDVPPNRDSTLVTVHRGESQATGQGQAVTLYAGNQVEFSGKFLQHQVRRSPRLDSFDKWCQVRDQRLDDAVSARYVQPSVVGGNDLEEFRAWQTPGYGWIWAPIFAPGLPPYIYEYSIWNGPLGLTWVYGAALGATPFHYSHWVY